MLPNALGALSTSTIDNNVEIANKLVHATNVLGMKRVLVQIVPKLVKFRTKIVSSESCYENF